MITYERVLTSGVALLAMSVGALIVGADFRRIIAEVLTRPDGDRTRIVAADFEAVRRRHPRIIARALAALYDWPPA